MSPEQCRAARALLNWSQDRLATVAKVGPSTVADFERGAREPKQESLLAMTKALSRAGVEFIDRNGGGPGVRLKR